MRPVVGLIAALLAWPAVPRAHPHGTLDCAVQLGAADGPGAPRLGWLALQLTLDAASSQSLLPRIQLEGAAQPGANESPEARQARLFTQMVAGLFRQSGWMLQLRADGATAPAPELHDPDPPRFTQVADGRLQVSVRLQPQADAQPLALDGLEIACRDPVWYWLTGFRQAGQVQLATTAEGTPPRCQAQLGELQREADQAQALQSAALRAGSAGADQMAAGLATAEGRRSATATMRCTLP